MKAELLLACALVLTHCGGELVRAPSEGGVDGASDAQALDAGALDAEDELRTRCSYKTCNGSITYCPPPMVCPEGDGCNTCRCTLQSDNRYYINCTARVCYCAPIKDGGT